MRALTEGDNISLLDSWRFFLLERGRDPLLQQAMAIEEVLPSLDQRGLTEAATVLLNGVGQMVRKSPRRSERQRKVMRNIHHRRDGRADKEILAAEIGARQGRNNRVVAYPMGGN